MMKAGRLRKLLILLIGVLSLPVTFYAGFEIAADHIVSRYELPRQARNGVKHAYTAAVLCNLLRKTGVAQDDAESLLLLLGTLNERMEIYVKIWKQDDGAEIRKDLHNNWAGVAAAKWRLDHAADMELSEAVALLAKDKALMLSPVALPADSETHGIRRVSEAQAWLRDHQQAITEKIVNALNGQRKLTGL